MRAGTRSLIRVSEAPQSHRGQPVVCLVYSVAVRSQSTHHICLNTRGVKLPSFVHATSLFGVQQSLSVTAQYNAL